MFDKTTPPPELPFSPPIPRMPRKKRRCPLLKAVWKSICEGHPGPLFEHFGKEWRNLRKYPGILLLTVGLAAFAAWWITRWWYFDVPYTGDTELTLFFPSDGGEPQTVSKVNVYHAYTLVMNMAVTTPKNSEEVFTGAARCWVIFLAFDKQVDSEKTILQARGLGPEMVIQIPDFTRRAATVVVTPKRGTEPERVPKGYLEIRSTTRTSDFGEMIMQPSPTPGKGASPP